MRNKRWLIGGCVAALFIAQGVAFYVVHQNDVAKMDELENHIELLTEEEQHATVMQSVNKQMEEIANEERRISDEQREEAEDQRMQAEKERQRAEEQRREAEEERQNALVAERRAIEASKTAQQQRAEAEQQRAAAEHAKSVADTLSYITLASNLGNSAITQYKAGNHEEADMLAFMACRFTERYQGDIFMPTVYQALAITSQNKNVWNRHKGSVTDIAFFDDADKGHFLSCSTYGEVLDHHYSSGGKLNTKPLFCDSQFDFRDLYIDRKTLRIYAISRTSQIVIIDGKNNKLEKIINVSIPKLERLEIAGSQKLLFGDHMMGLLDENNLVVTKTKPLPFRTVTICRKVGLPIIFDDKGNQHLIISIDKLETSKVPVKGQVTAYAESKSQKIETYGMLDGTLCYVDAKGNISRLAGHSSRISKLKINGKRIYSTSYDGTLILWMTNQPKIEPMTLFTTGGWLMTFTYDPNKYSVWTGDQKGNITRSLISVPNMLSRLQNKLKRNFTQEEWSHYVGKNVPYEKLK